ncbi:MAG: PhnD/SsuA/transferrin family substrate-binding protein [Acidimicrobiia bacterium]|nr:PhnD/SsuA/transferrin family substrate-binding protein [Acidimicrobiia bacterium]
MNSLRFGTFLAPNIMPVYQATADAVAAALGIATKLVVETSYENCRNDVNDVCFVCSLPYVMFEREGVSPATPVAAPVLRCPRYQGRPVYFSDVIVRPDSDIHEFSDLRGRSWAYNEPLSHSGYGITRYHLVTLGETSGFFGEVVEAGYHQTAIELVRDGDVDASAIDSQVLEVAMNEVPGLSVAIRIIDSLGPSPIQPVAISKRIDPELRAAIIDVVTGMHQDPTARTGLQAGLVERFVKVGPAYYDPIRKMLDTCEAAGFTVLR